MMAVTNFIAPACLYFSVLYLRLFLTPGGDFIKGNYLCIEGFEISPSLTTLDVGSATFLSIARRNQAAILKSQSGSSISQTLGSPCLFLFNIMIL